MYEWVVRITAAAVALTVAGYILPKGNIRKAAMLAFGFLFLMVLLLPLGNLASDILRGKAALDLEKNTLLLQTEGDAARQQVLERYKERIGEEIVSALGKISLSCERVTVAVDEAPESETFGYILSVSCSVSGLEEGGKPNTIDKVTVPEIVVDFHGVHLEDGNRDPTEQDAVRVEQIRDATDAIAALTGIEKEQINVKWGEKT